MALDLRELHGPEVDAALSVPEPTVDLWETGQIVPRWVDLLALAELTDFPVAFFFRKESPRITSGFICGPRKCVSLSPPAPIAPVIPLRPENRPDTHPNTLF